MDNMFENIAPSISKFTSEIVVLPNHGVVDLHNETETETAYREILRFLFKTIKQMENPKKSLEQSNELAKLRLKGLHELKELKPYISPYTLSRLNAEFRTWRGNPQLLSEQRSDNMDKKIDKGFNDAIAEFMDLAGVHEDEAPCDDFDFAACLDVPCEDEPEMSDEMGMELKDNEEELDESIRDFLPKAGAFRNDDRKMIGGFVGNGSKDRIEKAKKIAMAKFYNGDRMGRVTDEEIDNFDEVYAELMRRAGRENELEETAQPKSYLKSINEATEEEPVEVEEFEAETTEENPADEIRMDVPLFMRCLEFAREDAQDDADLHHLVEKAVELSKDGKALTMDNYDELSGGVSEGIVDEAKDPNVDAEWKTVRQNAKANPSLYGGRYTDKDAKKARKEWEADRKENLKEGCSVKRKWKRIEKKSK